MASLLQTHLRIFLAAGGAAGNITVTGILATDVIVSVSAVALTEGGPNTFSGITNPTAEFSVTAADTINNTGGTSTANKLLVVVVERAPGGTPKGGKTGYRP